MCKSFQASGFFSKPGGGGDKNTCWELGGWEALIKSHPLHSSEDLQTATALYRSLFTGCDHISSAHALFICVQHWSLPLLSWYFSGISRDLKNRSPKRCHVSKTRVGIWSLEARRAIKDNACFLSFHQVYPCLAGCMDLQVWWVHPLGASSHVISSHDFCNLALDFVAPASTNQLQPCPHVPLQMSFILLSYFPLWFVFVDLKLCLHSCNNTQCGLVRQRK